AAAGKSDAPMRAPLRMPGPKAARLGAVAADAHGAPLPRTVARVVDERPPARVRAAGLQLLPRTVGHRLGDCREHERDTSRRAALPRRESDRPVLEPDGETGAPRDLVEHRGRRVPVDLDAVVRAEQLAQCLAYCARIVCLAVACTNLHRRETMVGEPAHEPGRLAKVVTILVELGSVHEGFDQLQRTHNLC